MIFHANWIDCVSEKSWQSFKIIQITVFFAITNKLLKDFKHILADFYRINPTKKKPHGCHRAAFFGN